MEREHEYLSEDGLRLFYRHYDGDRSRAALLCLHGLTRNSADFVDLARHVAPGRRVLAGDIRGRGRSDRDPNWQNYYPGAYVKDMWRLLDHSGVERCVPIGTSMGGIMAMLMAVQQPARVAGVILNDIGPAAESSGLDRIAAATGQPPPRSWDEAVAQTRQFWQEALPDLDDAGWERFARAGFREGDGGVPQPDYDPDVTRRFLEDSRDAAEKLWPLFEAISQPILLLRGEHSDILSRATAERMRASKPGLQLVEVPRRGHMPLLDEPEALAAIDAFLASLP